MKTSTELQKILDSTTFRIIPGTFVYAKTKTVPTGKHFMISQDDDEVTVITTLEKLPGLDLLERNKDDYLLIEMKISVPFYSVGFWSTITSAIASRQANILAVSTYSKDYALVRVEHREVAREALKELGLKEVKATVA